MSDSSSRGYLVLESGETFEGRWLGSFHASQGQQLGRSGEVVFNTSHCGYEEIASDPSYYSQIVVMTSPMQGNYGSRDVEWESSRLHLSGMVVLEMQNSILNRQWLRRLNEHRVPVLAGVDTRKVTLRIRESGTPWGAIVKAEDSGRALSMATDLVRFGKSKDKDWCYSVSSRESWEQKGTKSDGPRVAVLDFGCKKNILQELMPFTSTVGIFSSRISPRALCNWAPDGIVLSNGPGDPADVKNAVETVRELLGWKPIFGICMGHQILALALGGSTHKLIFGHRGGNHPVRDEILGKIYMTSQNHGYVVDRKTLPSEVKVTHTNLYDQTIEGITSDRHKCFSVQFHPESHPGPRDAQRLFSYFESQLK